MKQIYLKCLSFLLLTLLAMSAYAQKPVTGTVTEKSGQPIPGVSVTEKGTKNGTSTDANGKFSLSVGSGATLVFTSIGLSSKEVAVGNSATVNVVLEDDANALNEVVVTALGIRREKKSLGYAVQEVKGETLVEAREPNLVNALSGKVAGLQITRSSNGPGASSRITLRGNNSLTGDNQPLIVIDGVPMNNFIGNVGGNDDYFNPTLDMGNGLSDINAEDIESMTVLKGPSAAALYGTRAGNGAILITTKTGKLQNGLGITVSSSVGIESIFARPATQNDFGQGIGGAYDETSRTSWGPKIEGQSVKKWDGTMAPLSAFDNVSNYFGNGVNSNQSISFQQQYKSTSIYTSYSRLDDKSMIPGVKLTRNNLMARAVSKFGPSDRWTTDTKVQYINSTANNRPQGGPRNDNTFYALSLLPRSIDITDFRAGRDANNKMLWYNEGNEYNPYWSSKYNLNQDVRDRFLLNGSLKYEFNDWLNAEVRGGADTYTTNTSARTYAGVTKTSTGQYSVGKDVFTETNFSTLLTARKDNLFGKFGGVVTLGGNLMSQESSYLRSSAGNLKVPDLFSVNNGTSSPTVDEGVGRRKINSVYGSLGLNYDGYLFVDGTFRNDWSSALSKANRSFFYPSVSASFLFTELMSKSNGLPAWLTYGKIRGSYSQVGNDMQQYQLYNVYTIGKDPNGNTTASRGNTLFDPSVKSELIKNIEAGLEMRFFNSRLGLDLGLYKSNATRQLLNLPMDPLSGYSFRKINGGDIENKGVELMVDGKLFTNSEGFNWNTTANFSINRNIVNSIGPDVNQYALGRSYDDISILAVSGERFGEIYGSHFLRVTDPGSEYFGQLILGNTGLPQKDPTNIKLGNQQASSLLGVTNAFSYKGFGLSFLVDARFGGKIFSGTLADMEQYGTSSKTVVNGSRSDMVVDGVVVNGSGYAKNTTATTAENYWRFVAGSGNLGITEANLYDASNIRLRNVQISYELPRKLLAGSPVQRVKVGASCNNVWLITSHVNGLDPESVYSAGSNTTGFENGSSPTTRTFLFNLTLGF